VKVVKDESEAYAEYHNARYSYLMALIRQIAPDRNSRILDVGRSVFTNILLASYPNVQTLGFGSTVDSVSSVPRSVPHIAFDLNRVQDTSEWIELPQFDLIVFAEVIEHLYTAPEVVMRFLCSGLAMGGYCIVQTPNAVSLHKRVLFICGRNPYERIRIDNSDPGHFREYTKRELLEIGGFAGMIAVKHDYKNYFGVWHGGRAKKLAGKVLDLMTLPLPSLRRGQTIVFKRLTPNLH
jgi:hypothetical protein